MSPIISGATNPPEVGRYSDKGPRSHNEDCSWIPERDREIPPEKGYLYIVADGVGGHAAGEVASLMAVKHVPDFYYEDANADILTSLQVAIERANREIYHEAANNLERRGMASTITVVVVRGGELFVANVGDSRTYLIQDKQIKQISYDHTWVNEQVNAGILTPEEARNHGRKNVVTRSLGNRLEVKVDTFGPYPIKQGDSLILCSDGLTEVLDETTLLETMTKDLNAKKTAQTLLQMALDRDTPDNVTCIVLRITETPAVNAGFGVRQTAVSLPAPKPPTSNGNTILSINRAIMFGAVAAFLLIIFLGVIIYRESNTVVSVVPLPNETIAQATSTQTPTPFIADTPTAPAQITTASSVVTPTPALAPTAIAVDAVPTSLQVVAHDRPILLEPAPNHTFQPEQPINLLWELASPLQAGERYWIAINQEGGGPISDAKQTSVTPEFEIATGLAPGTYRWIIIIENASQQILARSDTGVFTVVGGTTPSSTNTTITPSPKATEAPPQLGEITLDPINETIQGPATFIWRYEGQLPAHMGFEVRVWREGEPPQGVHDAVLDNKVGRIEPFGDNRYRLQVDITAAAGVANRGGDYLWSVFLIEIDPVYKPLNIPPPEPKRLTFAIPGGGGDSSGGNNSGGGDPPPGGPTPED